MRRRVFISIFTILFVFVFSLIILRLTLFSNESIEKAFIHQFEQQAPELADKIQYSKINFKFRFHPTVEISDYEIGKIIKLDQFRIKFPFHFYFNHAVKPLNYQLNHGTVKFIVQTDSSSIYSAMNQYVMLLFDRDLEMNHLNLYFQNSNDNINLLSFMKKLQFKRFTENKKEKIEIIFANHLKDFSLNNSHSRIQFDKKIQAKLNLMHDTDSNWVILPESKLLINKEKIPFHFSKNNELLRLLFSVEQNQFVIQYNRQAVSVSVSGEDSLLGDYHFKSGIFLRDKYFSNGEFQFEKEIITRENGLKGRWSGNLAWEFEFKKIEDLKVFGSVRFQDISHYNLKCPLQLNGNINIRDNKLLLEDFKFGYGKSYFKIGGTLNSVNSFILSSLLKDDQYQSNLYLYITSQYADFAEISANLKNQFKKAFIRFSIPNCELNTTMNCLEVDFKKIQVEDSKFKLTGNKGIWEFSLEDSKRKDWINFKSEIDYRDLDSIQVSTYLDVKNYPAKELFETIFNYPLKIRSQGLLTLMSDFQYHLFEDRVIENLFKGKFVMQNGYFQDEPFWNGLSMKYEIPHLKNFGFKHGEFNFHFDLFKKELSFYHVNFAGKEFSLKGSIEGYQEFNFKGDLFVLKENLSSWSQYADFSYDQNLDLYYLPVQFKSTSNLLK